MKARRFIGSESDLRRSNVFELLQLLPVPLLRYGLSSASPQRPYGGLARGGALGKDGACPVRVHSELSSFKGAARSSLPPTHGRLGARFHVGSCLEKNLAG
jgi:hypothetical protein